MRLGTADAHIHLAAEARAEEEAVSTRAVRSFLTEAKAENPEEFAFALLAGEMAMRSAMSAKIGPHALLHGAIQG